GPLIFFGLNRLFVRPLALRYYGWLLERQTHAKSRVVGLRLQVDRSVVLSHTFLVVKKGSKTRPCASAGIPGPLSSISTTAQSSSRRVRTRSSPLPFIASMALSIRLVHT